MKLLNTFPDTWLSLIWKRLDEYQSSEELAQILMFGPYSRSRSMSNLAKQSRKVTSFMEDIYRSGRSTTRTGTDGHK